MAVESHLGKRRHPRRTQASRCVLSGRIGVRPQHADCYDAHTTIRQRETAGGGTTQGSPFFPYRFYAATGIAAQLLAFVGMCSIVNGARAPRLAVYG